MKSERPENEKREIVSRSVLKGTGRKRNGADFCTPGIENYSVRGRARTKQILFYSGCRGGAGGSEREKPEPGDTHVAKTTFWHPWAPKLICATIRLGAPLPLVWFRTWCVNYFRRSFGVKSRFGDMGVSRLGFFASGTAGCTPAP